MVSMGVQGRWRQSPESMEKEEEGGSQQEPGGDSLQSPWLTVSQTKQGGLQDTERFQNDRCSGSLLPLV